jgi:hypothetical protein
VSKRFEMWGEIIKKWAKDKTGWLPVLFKFSNLAL